MQIIFSKFLYCVSQFCLIMENYHKTEMLLQYFLTVPLNCCRSNYVIKTELSNIKSNIFIYAIRNCLITTLMILIQMNIETFVINNCGHDHNYTAERSRA